MKKVRRFYSGLVIFSLLSLLQAGVMSREARSDFRREDYPDRLSVEFVLRVAEKQSSFFKDLRAQETAVEVGKLQVDALYDPSLTFGVRKIDNRNEPANPFAPNRTESTQWFLGLEQGVALTGTRLQIELQHGNTNLNFPMFAFAPYFETRATLNARQSLLHSLWHGADRYRSEAGNLSKKLSELQVQKGRDQATLMLIELFYRAWLAQTDVKAAQANYQNLVELYNMTQIRVRRGTGERPDLLQARSGVDQAKVQLDRANRQLGDIWRYLVVTLDLPKELFAMDPMKIPADLDQPIALAAKQCQKNRTDEKSLPVTLQQLLAQVRTQATQAQSKAAMASQGTDVLVNASYFTNAIDNTKRSETFRSVGAQDFPAWSLEVSARIPLGSSQADSEATRLRADLVRAETAEEQEAKVAALERLNRCLELQEKQSARDLAQTIFKTQTERLELEKQRFNLGRSNLTQVVLASQDRVQSERALRGAEVDERLIAWKTLELEGRIFEQAVSTGPTSAKRIKP